VVAEGIVNGDNLKGAEVVAGPAVDVVRLLLAFVLIVLLAALVVSCILDKGEEGVATTATATATLTFTYAARRE